MGIFTREPRPERKQSKAAKRAAMLPTQDLIPWAETCLYQVGRNLSDFQKEADPFALAEATQAAATLQILMDEINERFDVPDVSRLG